MNLFESISGKLVVSCQALAGEPLHGAEIMSRMAVAACKGGAGGVIANGVADIVKVKECIGPLPVIGVLSRIYLDSEVALTATMREIDELMEAGPAMIGLDATFRLRPNGETLNSFVQKIRARYPNVPLMAEISTLEEAVTAEQQLGFECVSSAAHGYTEATAGCSTPFDNCAFIRELRAQLSCFLIAEGGIATTEQAATAIQAGADAVVVGSAITRPQLITARFADAVRGSVANLLQDHL